MELYCKAWCCYMRMLSCCGLQGLVPHGSAASVSLGQGSPVPTLIPTCAEMADPRHPVSQGLNAFCSQWIDRSICEKSGHGYLIQQPRPFPIYLI